MESTPGNFYLVTLKMGEVLMQVRIKAVLIGLNSNDSFMVSLWPVNFLN